MTDQITEKYISEREVSEITGFALPTLRNHRSQKIGIPYLKLSARKVAYSLKDVIAYMESHRIQTNGGG